MSPRLGGMIYWI